MTFLFFHQCLNWAEVFENGKFECRVPDPAKESDFILRNLNWGFQKQMVSEKFLSMEILVGKMKQVVKEK